MAELVTTYNLLENSDNPVAMDRGEFYAEQLDLFRKTGKPSKAIAVVSVLLFNARGELFVQKRSSDKAHNPGLLDKSVGGHIQFGDTGQYTAMIETVQELQVPSVTLPTEREFNRTYSFLEPHLHTVSVLRFMDSQIKPFTRIVHGEKVEMVNKYYLYFGVYNGAIKMVDRESTGVLLYSLENLKKELSSYPNMFTHDLQFYIQHYEKDIKKFIEGLKSTEL